MAQTLIVYLAVAVAAAWIAWSVLLPRSVRQGLKRRLARQGAFRGGSKPDGCNCGGGCSD